MPARSRPGLLLLASGLFADLAYHCLPPTALPALIGETAHVVVLVGMLLVVASVIAQGLAAGKSRA